ncbi:MAG: macro domain-containing protein [Cytophagales bacterium]|nr:macro domain-containing protein [Armatimonadota bacterium]
MRASDVTRQLPYFLFVLSLFTAYGILVRRGTIREKNILWAGVGVGVAAVAAAVVFVWPDYQRGAPVPLLLIHPVMMTLVSAYCVWLTYRSQRVETLATHDAGDTKILVISCLPARMPDADALLLPGNTLLRMVGGVSGAVGIAAGGEVEKEAIAAGPVGIGKVTVTGGGRLAVGRIYHVAVHEPLKPVVSSSLKRGMESAILQARKDGAESVAVPLGALRGLAAQTAMETMAEAVLKQRKAFGEIVFVVFDARSGNLAAEVVRRAIETAQKPAANRP